MSDDRCSRRELLQGLGLGAAAFLPLLHARPLRGAEPAFPKRLIIVQTTNGVFAKGFWPKTVHETDFELETDVLRPLVPFKKDILLLGGMEMRASMDDPIATSSTTGHESLQNLLTGCRSMSSGVVAPGKGGWTFPVGGGISVDQHIANAIAKSARLRFPSLELAVMNRSQAIMDKAISYRAAKQGNTGENSPYKVFASLFGDAPAPVGDPAATERLRRLAIERRSVLDAVHADLAALGKRLGADDRAKLEGHAEALRKIEREIIPGTGASGTVVGCGTPAVGSPPMDIFTMKNYGKVFQLHADVLTAAMACDLVRVATVMFSDSHGGGNELAKVFAPILGPDFSDDHHAISHKMGAGADGARRKNRVEEWYMEQFAYLLGKLRSVREGSGTMLDNTVVWWANHMSDGAAHAVRGMPWLLAGRCGGYFRTGRYLRYGDWAQGSYAAGSKFVPHNGLLVALANAMDAPVQTFGDAKYGGQLPNLT